MNTARELFLTSSIALLLCSGCGGGGNDGTTDDNDRNVSGVWSGAITKTGDSCSSGLPQVVNFRHAITQNGGAVELTDENAIQYLGNLVGEDGFSVDANQTVTANGRSCQDARRIEYDSVVDDDDTTADFDFTITRTCQGSAACTIAYTGTAARSAGDNGGTSATPTPLGTITPTTVSGGCADMNINTNTGTYSGDGGCGISDASLRKDVQGTESLIVLEPFGGNGATTFVINPSATSSATSRRSDLSINGTAGYTCSLVCSPPSTFTATCTKEGGTSCTEKF